MLTSTRGLHAAQMEDGMSSYGTLRGFCFSYLNSRSYLTSRMQPQVKWLEAFFKNFAIDSVVGLALVAVLSMSPA